jgi:anthranilate/para-aminobenzoate synthase component II
MILAVTLPRFSAIRYHSLCATPESVPASLEVTARTKTGVIMALRHREYPVHGVQFHPESILSEHGKALLSNFLGMRVPAVKTERAA